MVQASPPGCSLFLLHTFLELVDASAGIHQLLTTGKERMAFRTDINVKLFLNGAGFECFAACAMHKCLAIFGMYSLFHNIHLSKVVARIPAKSLDTYATPETVVAERFYNKYSDLSILIVTISTPIIAVVARVVVAAGTAAALITLAVVRGFDAAHRLKDILVIKGDIDR